MREEFKQKKLVMERFFKNFEKWLDASVSPTGSLNVAMNSNKNRFFIENGKRTAVFDIGGQFAGEQNVGLEVSS